LVFIAPKIRTAVGFCQLPKDEMAVMPSSLPAYGPLLAGIEDMNQS